MTEKLRCPSCGYRGVIDDFDLIMACPGNVFCPDCHTEIDHEGHPALLCGDCGSCKMLKRNGQFQAGQHERIAKRIEHMQMKPGAWQTYTDLIVPIGLSIIVFTFLVLAAAGLLQ